MALPRPQLHPRLAPALLWVGIFLVSWYQSWLAIQKASLHDWFTADLGNMWEAVWRLGHGLGFTFTYRGEVISRLVFHADYLLGLLAPVSWIWKEATPLLIIQAFSVAVGAWFVWSIARRLLGSSKLGYAFAFAWLMYGPMLFPVIWQFHIVTVAPTLMLAAAEAVIAKRRAWIFWVWFGLAAISKEQAGAVVGLFAALVHWKWGSRKTGIWSLAAGFVLTAVNFFLIIPAFRTENSHFVWKYYYGDLGQGTGQELHKLILPSVWVPRLASAPLANNFVMLLAPVGGLALLNWWWLVGLLTVLPAWLAQFPESKDVFHQNHVLMVPFIFVGAIVGAGQLLQWFKRFSMIEKALTTLVVSAALLCNFLFTPFPWSAMWNSNWLLQDPDLDKIVAYRYTLPDDASVAYTLGLGRAYRSFPHTDLMPDGIEVAEYVAVYDIPTYDNTERIGGLQWRTFNHLVLEYLNHSPDVTPKLKVARGGVFQIRTADARTKVSNDIKDLFVTSVRALNANHEE